MDKVFGIVYCITNMKNNKKYIGQTVRELELRRKEHIWKAERRDGYAIHQAIRKYGADSFEWVILCSANNQEELNEKEIHWIDYYNSYYKGYNMAFGGQSNLSETADELSLMRGGREFLVFDLEGRFIKSAISQKQFAEEIGMECSLVNQAIKMNRPSVRGYIVIFKHEFSDELLSQLLNRTRRPFYVFKKSNFAYVGKWDNRQQCSINLGISKDMIGRYLRNNNENSRGDYLFYYYSTLPQNLKIKIKEVV